MSDIHLDSLVDILPPEVPESLSEYYGIYIALIVIFLLAGSLLWAFRSNQWKLIKLRWLYQSQKISKRQLAYQLERLLCQKLGLFRIAPSLVPASINPDDSDHWKSYSTQLQTACYSREGLNDTAMKDLLTGAGRWL